jgi:hypothetical protein
VACTTGTYQGDNTDCDPNPCPQAGACCATDGSCLVTTQAGCTTGVYQGDGTVCAPNPCLAEAEGACCVVGGCTVLTQAACATSGGDYQGDGSTCDPDPCVTGPTGACCFPSGHCTVTTQGSCLNNGGSYSGTDTECDPSPCPQPPSGACCFTSGSCFVMQQGDCDVAIGSYQGDDTPCEPNPCPPADGTGACCDAEGCRITTEGDCLSGDGFFLGAGHDCSPDPCPDPGDLLGIWELSTEAFLCETDSSFFTIAFTDTICTLDDPYDPDDIPGDTICKYEVDGDVLVATCRSTSEDEGCVSTTISVVRYTFGSDSYSGSGIFRTTSTGTCNTQDCFEYTFSAVRTGPPPDPCPTSGREDQMKSIAAGVMERLRR